MERITNSIYGNAAIAYCVIAAVFTLAVAPTLAKDGTISEGAIALGPLLGGVAYWESGGSWLVGLVIQSIPLLAISLGLINRESKFLKAVVAVLFTVIWIAIGFVIVFFTSI